MPANFSTFSSSPVAATGSASAGKGKAAAHGDEEFNPWLTYDMKDIKTKMVKVKERLPDGREVEVEKEMVCCPECGSVSCGCLAQVTLQRRFEEENAKGVKNEPKPDPMAILGQNFNQMSQNVKTKSSFF